MFIYRLYIGNNTIYIGKTKNIKQRYNHIDCLMTNWFKNKIFNDKTIANIKDFLMIMLKLNLYENIPEIILNIWNN